MKGEVDESRLLVAAVAMHGFLSSPQQYTIDEIVSDSAKIADKLIAKLEATEAK